MSDASVIGLGAMGVALARVLIGNGYRVTVWNRTARKAAPLVEAGATLAPTPGDAVAASPATIVCVRTHADTRAILQAAPAALAGKTIIELSTGGARDAEALARWIEARGAACLIGMIATFPTGIGKPDTTIVTAGAEAAWTAHAAMLRSLAGKSSYIGADVGALAALFAGLFLPRQGFMFGMIYGALVCEKAGVPMETYVEQLPLTLKLVHDYYDVFAASVPSGDFSNPPVNIATLLAAFEDVLETFEHCGVAGELPELLHRLMQQGVDAGLAHEQVTALTKVLRG
jgi:3-hydroxyisobutyrate dehydrogenase-like beta-hydroxyacid dehydrogenase